MYNYRNDLARASNVACQESSHLTFSAQPDQAAVVRRERLRRLPRVRDRMTAQADRNGITREEDNVAIGKNAVNAPNRVMTARPWRCHHGRNAVIAPWRK